MPASTPPALLFVTDFSDTSVQALKWAISEAQHHHLHLSVLYPYRLDQERRKDNVVLSKKALETDAAEKFEEQLEEILNASRVSFKFQAEVGFIRDRISEHAKKNNVVMVVMGEQTASAESFPEIVEGISVPIVIVPSLKA